MSTHAIKNENRPNPRTATSEKKGPFLSGDGSCGNKASDGVKNLVKKGGGVFEAD